MKFKIMRSHFIEGLKSVQNIVTNKGSLPILQNVLLEANGKELKMTTTDFDISIKVTCECTVIEQGVTTLPVKYLFSSILVAAEGEIEVEVDAMERAIIKAGSAKYKLVGMPASGFPKLPEQEDAFAYRLQQVTFKEMLRKVAYAASQDDTRRALKGVLMSFKDQKLTMVATDGRRLALVENEMEFPVAFEKDIVLPSKAVIELQRSLNGESEISLLVQKSQICFKLPNIIIYSKLLDEVYPNYKQVIPNETIEHVTIDRQLLLDAVSRVSVIKLNEAHSIKLTFNAGKLVVSSVANDIGEAKDEVPIKYAGEEISIVFNPVYLMENLKVIDDDEIIFNFNNEHSPSVIKCSIPFLYVLMPLRIS